LTARGLGRRATLGAGGQWPAISVRENQSESVFRALRERHCSYYGNDPLTNASSSLRERSLLVPTHRSAALDTTVMHNQVRKADREAASCLEARSAPASLMPSQECKC
jgi:hypothetical protein